MGTFTDLTGKRFERLTVISMNPTRKNHKIMWNCKCDCGNEICVSSDRLTGGVTKSCGCIRKETAARTAEMKRTQNVFYVSGGIVHVQLPNTKKELLCDPDVWERLKGFRWRLHNKGYVSTKIGGITKLFHVLAFECPDGMFRDHINGVRTDNRASNIRIVNNYQNAQNVKLRYDNKTGGKGIHQLSSGNWNVAITANGKRINIGTYSTLEEAIFQRQEAEKRLFGDFRRK